jgi:hypothetical protein
MNTARQLIASIKRKRSIDKANETALNYISHDHWLADAVELLLLVELDKLNDAMASELNPLPSDERGRLVERKGP